MSFQRYLGSAAAFVSSILVALPACVTAQDPPDYRPGVVLVKFKSSVSSDDAVRAAAQEGASVAGEVRHTGYKVMKLPATANPTAALRAFGRRGDVEDVQLDHRRAPDAVPNDPQYGSEWHLTKIGGPGAWNISVGDSSVIVAILDTGVDPTHPDLVAKLVPGWNTYDETSNTADVYGHGTAVAGTAAASGNNGLGVASPAWNCSIMPVRISDTSGYGYSSTVSEGLTWAADHGAKVANISYAFNNDSVVKSAAQYFMSKGGVVTMSAGNSSYADPSADNPYVLTVSATDANDALASWSNTGNNVDLAAPGVSITTTCRGGGYGAWSGTSFSAPTVAGVAALVYSANPSLSGAQVQDVLKQSADDLGTAGWDSRYGWGRVNAYRAVTLATSYSGDTTPPTVSFVSPSAGATVTGTATLFVSAMDNVGVDTVELWKDGVLVQTLLTTPYSWSWNTLTESNATHTFKAVAKDLSGNSATATLNLVVANTQDTTAPTVTITSPTGGYIASMVTVSVAATDNVGVVKTELYVDGKLAASSTTSPFTMKWNAKKASRGNHTLSVKAYDAAGNVGTSQTVTVTK